MSIFVGLGNPGEKYQHSRHNVGWMFLEYVAQKQNFEPFILQKKVFSELVKQDELLLVKPQTFMNDSGKAVQAVVKWYGEKVERLAQSSSSIHNLFIIYDDLDIELGKFKIQFGSGPKIHNGLNSIRDHLGTDQFWNVRIGVDSRKGDRSLSGSEYVLQNFSPDEHQVLQTEFADIYAQIQQKV
ncbi:MAG: aminoacyl-tRNA hydrolase [Patescibacteria group bacterium]